MEWRICVCAHACMGVGICVYACVHARVWWN